MKLIVVTMLVGLCCGGIPKCTKEQSPSNPGAIEQSLSITCQNLDISSLSNWLEIPSNYYNLTIVDCIGFHIPSHFSNQLGNVEKLVIQNSGVTTISKQAFSYFPSIREIEIKHNNLSTIKNGVFTYYGLVKLDLSYNSIETIEENSISEHIQEIYLNDNRIQKIPYEWFSIRLSRLRRLDLSHNFISIYWPLYDNFQRHASNLEELFLSHNQMLDVPSLAELRNLKKLDLSYNSIDSINDSFSRNTQLQEMLLNNNNIQNIHDSAFHPLHLLSILNLSHNCLHGFGGDLIPSSIKMLDLSYNKITYFNESVFSALKNLSFLDISFNPVLHADNTITSFSPNLKVFRARGLIIADNNITLLEANHRLNELSLANNVISQVKENIFNHLAVLQILTLSHNLISHLDNLSFLGLYSLEELYLDNNNITVLPEMIFVWQKHLKLLDISNNPILNVEIPLIQKLINLEVIYLNNLRLEEYSKAIRLLPGKASALYLSRNRITMITHKILSNLSEIITLDVSYNSINYVDGRAFCKQFKLKSLYIQGNFLHTISPRLFKNQNGLIHLDLSNNKLESIPIGTLDSCENLITLNISFNRIRKLKAFNLYSLKKVEQFYIDNNNLSNLEGIRFMENLREISLQNNSWNCDDLFNVQNELVLKHVVIRNDFPTASEHILMGTECNDTTQDETNDYREVSSHELQAIKDHMNEAFQDIEHKLERLFDTIQLYENSPPTKDMQVQNDTGNFKYLEPSPKNSQINNSTAFKSCVIIIMSLMLIALCVLFYLHFSKKPVVQNEMEMILQNNC